MKSILTISVMLHGFVGAFADFSYGTSVLPSLEEYEFRNWMRDHGKVYHTKEKYKFRFEIYKRNQRRIARLKHEKRDSHGDTRYKASLWSDISDDEFNEKFPILPKKNLNATTNAASISKTVPSEEFPLYKNWWADGFVTGVRSYSDNCPA
jgi:hypothetical protein